MRAVVSRTESNGASAGIGQGWDMLTEVIAAFVTWGGIGWGLDRWLGTEPWLMVAGLLLGHVASVYLMWLRSQRPDERHREADAAVTDE